MASESQAAGAQSEADSTWTYPTRSCRLCHEEVVPTVAISNSSLPAPFRSTTISYVSEEGGKLIKPCKCKGTQRYIHEDCLTELRAKSPQKNAYLKCDLCGYQYNTKRLLVHDILLSRVARMLLTMVLVAFVMFVLGFFADPIINLYVDPLGTLAGQHYWDRVELENIGEKAEGSWWVQHFMKGLVSVGVMGFFKAVLLANPWNFWHLRHYGLLGGSTRTTTGRDRAINISWIAVVIGVGSALYFFYQQVAKFSQRTLSKFANNVIEVQMDDDDEDLKIPPSAERSAPYAKTATPVTSDRTATAEAGAGFDGDLAREAKIGHLGNEEAKLQSETTFVSPESPASSSSKEQGGTSSKIPSQADKEVGSLGWSSAIHEARTPNWSFNNFGA